MSNERSHSHPRHEERGGGSPPSDAAPRPDPPPDPKRAKLERRKLTLEVRKLETELKAFRWPGWWELGKFGVSLVAVVSIILGIVEYRSQRLDRGIDLLFEHPDQGAFILARRGEKGHKALLSALAGDVDDPLSARRLVSLGILRQLRGLGDDKIQNLLPSLAQHLERVEEPRTHNLLLAYQVALRPPKGTPAPAPEAVAAIETALCGQYHVSLSLASILAEQPEAREALDTWSRQLSETSVFEEKCR